MMIDNRNSFWNFIQHDTSLYQLLYKIFTLVNENPSFYDENYGSTIHDLMGIIIIFSTNEDNIHSWITPVSNLPHMSKPKRPLHIKQSPSRGKKYVIEDIDNGLKRRYYKDVEINTQLCVQTHPKGIRLNETDISQLYQGIVIKQSIGTKQEYNMFITKEQLLLHFSEKH